MPLPQCTTIVTNGVVDAERTSLLKWISKIPYMSHHKWICDNRLEGTCEWLFSKKEYFDWRGSSASKLLLLRGIRMFSFSSIQAISNPEHD